MFFMCIQAWWHFKYLELKVVQLQMTSFVCTGWCYGDSAVSWSPVLISELQAKKIIRLYNSIYPFKKFFNQKYFLKILSWNLNLIFLTKFNFFY